MKIFHDYIYYQCSKDVDTPANTKSRAYWTSDSLPLLRKGENDVGRRWFAFLTLILS